jgi:TIR domain
MPIKYSCFISYRHDSTAIAKDFQDALENELSLLINLPVYIDEDRLSGGQFFNKAIASALCQSACMIMIYIPRYFEYASPYCAREYKAMEQLELRRLAKLRRNGNSNPNGFIIPVVYRGLEVFPKQIKSNRQFYNFESYFLGGRTRKNNVKYLTAIKDIANYIFQRCQDLNTLPSDPCDGCEEFVIPPKSRISRWLISVVAPPPVFPGRGV